MLPWVTRGLGKAGLVLVFAVSFELSIRIQDWVRYRMPIFSTVTSEEDLMMRDSLGAHGRPNVRYRKWSMDSLGFRGPEVSVHAPAGTIRIALTGASETFGLYESPDKEYARDLEDTLNARLAAGACSGHAPRHFEVLNGALPGMSLPTAGQDIRTRIVRFAPDVIVYYPSPAQYLEDRLPVAIAPEQTGAARELPRSAMRALHPRALDVMRDELRLIMPAPLLRWFRVRSARSERERHPANWVFTSIPASRMSAFDSDLRALIGTVHLEGAELVLATHANAFERHRPDSTDLAESWERFYPRANGTTIIRFDDSARAVSERAAEDSAVVVADVHAMFARSPGDDFVDFVHFTDIGSERVAHVLANAVLQAERRRHVCGP
jgi:hypothetical protein